jgi:hypothetical protein
LLFTKNEFLPFLAIDIIKSYMYKTFSGQITSHPVVLEAVLSHNRSSGQHSGLLLVENEMLHEYVYSHPSSRPFGIHYPARVQCPKCGVLRFSNLVQERSEYFIICRKSQCRFMVACTKTLPNRQYGVRFEKATGWSVLHCTSQGWYVNSAVVKMDKSLL